jgi:peptidyl-prolyl cis-trans isomerase C
MSPDIARTVRFCLLSIALALHFSVAIGAHLVATDGTSRITSDELRVELSGLPADIRARVTADRSSLAKFVANLLRDKRIAGAAQVAGTDQMPVVRAAVARSTREIIVSRYLNVLEERVLKSAADFRSLAKERYESNKQSFVQPEALRVAHILIRVDAEDERVTESERRQHALSILDRLKAGEDFAALAREFSEDKGSSSRDGVLPGWIEREKTVPPFERAAFSLKPGETSNLVRTRFGYHIIKLLEYRKSMILSFSEVEQQLVAKLRAEYQAEHRAEVTKRFDGAVPVVLDDEFLNAVKEP